MVQRFCKPQYMQGTCPDLSKVRGTVGGGGGGARVKGYIPNINDVGTAKIPFSVTV